VRNRDGLVALFPRRRSNCCACIYLPKLLQHGRDKDQSSCDQRSTQEAIGTARPTGRL